MVEKIYPPWDLTLLKKKYAGAELPLVSIIIPTANDAQLIGATLESIFSQNYRNFEVIIIDSSEDRAIEVVKHYHYSNVNVYSFSQGKRYEMLNKGISQAKGEYVNILFPGDYYINRDALSQIMLIALDNDKADLVYCCGVIRDGHSEAKVFCHELCIDLLKKGVQPTNLQSCWFKTEVVRALGKFDPQYTLRGGYDLMCRFCLKGYRYALVNRVLIDYDIHPMTREMVAIHFNETLKIISCHFGILATLRWMFFYQKDTQRYFKLWVRSLRVAFSGRG